MLRFGEKSFNGFHGPKSFVQIGGSGGEIEIPRFFRTMCFFLKPSGWRNWLPNTLRGQRWTLHISISESFLFLNLGEVWLKCCRYLVSLMLPEDPVHIPSTISQGVGHTFEESSIYRSVVSTMLTPPKTNECPLKRDYFNRKYIFQPLIFKGWWLGGYFYR